ncbi:MAG: nucleotidyl transferase AbiEii/AbiGii toxin family protein [Myxococcales bacterium]|nr:nucleotidyl transferase AbiEii/AbiGii toxin family protein [Myxococcales bacterium]
MSKEYRTPAAFKTAVEQRLRQGLVAGQELGRDLGRARQLLVYDRFLARLAEEFGDAIVLKGGLALELRLRKARATKDMDVRASGDPTELLARLQSAGRLDLGDFMTFEVQRHKHPTIRAEGARYEGLRFRVEGKIAGKSYGSPFSLDIGIGDPMLGEPERVVAPDRLGFAGIAAPRVWLYPVETHLAEKLHAYTVREGGNSRDKDLPDMVLIASETSMVAERLIEAIARTFDFRATHSVPERLPRPPEAWRAPYAEKVREFDLPWETLDECYDLASRFFDPVLEGLGAARWEPEAWCWQVER